jgi:hypothetical protein
VLTTSTENRSAERTKFAAWFSPCVLSGGSQDRRENVSVREPSEISVEWRKRWSEWQDLNLQPLRLERERRPSGENGCSSFCRNVPSRMSEKLERVKGIEPSSSAWKAVALPLSYTRGEAIATNGSGYFSDSRTLRVRPRLRRHRCRADGTAYLSGRPPVKPARATARSRRGASRAPSRGAAPRPR